MSDWYSEGRTDAYYDRKEGKPYNCPYPPGPYRDGYNDGWHSFSPEPVNSLREFLQETDGNT